MKARIYFQHLLRINLNELENLPPFGPNQNLSDDELLDILLFGTPKSWQKEMEKQGFDPMENDLNDVVGFMEQIEAAEAFDNNKDVHQKKNGKNKGNNHSNKNGNGATKHCVCHGDGNHSTDNFSKAHFKNPVTFRIVQQSLVACVSFAQPNEACS